MAEYTLYGAPISLYTGKARAYLRYKGIAFEEVLSTFRTYKKIIIPKTGVRFIPVLKTPDETYIQDTADIIDYLEAKIPQRSVFPTSPKQALVAKLFEWYGDEWLLLPAMHYRWNMDQDDYVYGAFGQTTFPNFPKFLQRFIGKKLGAKFRGFVPLLGITDETIPALEHWFEEMFLPQLNQHFGEHNYLLGARASIGDFGLVGPLYAHLYLDPAPRKILEAKAPNVVDWIHRMNTAAPEVGEWLAEDEIPETLTPILTDLCGDFLSYMLSIPDALYQWRQDNPEKAIPRTIGNTAFALGDAKGQRFIAPFSQWKLQRVIAALPTAGEDKTILSDFLRQINGQQLLEVNVKAPVERRNNKLCWTP